MSPLSLKTITFLVPIPNLEGDGIAEDIPIEVQARFDPETGEDVLTAESVDLIEKTRARHMGLMSAGEMKALRDRLGLTQKEMSDLLQIGDKSYTRWESGRSRPSRSLNVLLCALRDGQIDVNYLRALRGPVARREWPSRVGHPLGLIYLSAEPMKSDLARCLVGRLRIWHDRSDPLTAGAPIGPDLLRETSGREAHSQSLGPAAAHRWFYKAERLAESGDSLSWQAAPRFLGVGDPAAAPEDDEQACVNG